MMDSLITVGIITLILAVFYIFYSPELKGKVKKEFISNIIAVWLILVIIIVFIKVFISHSFI